ncbi:MAG TPA: type 4a pilus biogenesis protein PilO [Longimicrobiales bacterium]|nr:type 4a pilus biogenesis protein PilO [Longimicrobiales bacterium]
MALLPSSQSDQRRLLVGIIPLALLFGYYQFMHPGRVAATEQLQDHYDVLVSRNDAAKSIARTGAGPDLERRIGIYEQHMKRLEQLIPSAEEVPQLLYSMTERAGDAGVELTEMSPQADEPGPYYTKSTYKIGVKGSYHDIGQFLSQVGSLSRIITPIDLRLVSDRYSETTRSGSPVLGADFTIVTYILPEPALAAPASDTTGTNVASS